MPLEPCSVLVVLCEQLAFGRSLKRGLSVLSRDILMYADAGQTWVAWF